MPSKYLKVCVPLLTKGLLLLSCFSCVWLCATPQTAAHQAPPSLGFSRQEHWSGLHFLLQCVKVKSESEVAQSCPTLTDPMDCSPPGSSVYGILQARALEWGAIAFSILRVRLSFSINNVGWEKVGKPSDFQSTPSPFHYPSMQTFQALTFWSITHSSSALPAPSYHFSSYSEMSDVC